MSRNYVSYDDMMEIARRIREQRGAANGVAPLDGSGHVPAANLPSYVDDVLEYAAKSAFPATGESGKIYIAADTNMTYRWSGTQYVEISSSLALGETASTAYPGDKGKANAAGIAELRSGKNDKITVSDNSAALTDNDAVLTGSAGSNPTSIGRRLLSSLWTYIKGKISSVLGLTETTLSSKTMTGALNFANKTWNLVGDDVYIGDFDRAGTLGVKGANGETKIAIVKQGNDANYVNLHYDGTRLNINKSIMLPDGKHIYFGATDDMAIGHGTPPAQFTEELQSDKLVTGAYMAHGNDETGGIIVGGDGIDMWTPPDRHLVRFWNEDMGIPVASIDGHGWLYGKARSAERGTVQYIGSWLSLMNRIGNEMSKLGDGEDDDDIVPGIYGFAGDGYIGSDTTFFVKGTDSPCPSSSYNRWIVTTRLTRDANDGDVYGVQVAWAVTSSASRANYKRCYLGEDGWSAWTSNDL